MEAEPGAHFFTVIAGAKLASVAGAGGALLTRIKKEPSEKEYVCVICSAFMIGDEDYQAHMEQHNAQSQFNFPCSDCDGSFASRYDLETHTLQTHSQLMKFEYAHIKEEVQINEAPPLTEARLDLLANDAKCPRCSEYFATKILLRDHQIAEHPEYYTGYLCRHNKCNQKFYKYDEYIHHLAEHKLKHTAGRQLGYSRGAVKSHLPDQTRAELVRDFSVSRGAGHPSPCESESKPALGVPGGSTPEAVPCRSIRGESASFAFSPTARGERPRSKSVRIDDKLCDHLDTNWIHGTFFGLRHKSNVLSNFEKSGEERELI
ncbi:unnamed protein product [Hermetia illucens]|uniref:C2H2-type domain-containing protein n=1 Tax=Hermetia illucens TaxID=343691 RepID=A0A7R8YNI8_HERIL|nr:unnamed protein product [Hermetia illucens]